MPRLRNAAACLHAAEKAFGWLESRFENEAAWAGSSLPLDAYHKVPYLLLVTGRLELCRTALSRIRSRLLTAQGSLLRVPAAKDAPLQPASVNHTAWITLAAHLSGRLDISYPTAGFLASCQGRSTGGVHESTDGGPAPDADVRTTACAGLAYLACGYLEEARRAGTFLARTVMLQAEEKRFHVRANSLGRPVRNFPREEADSYVLARARGRAELSYLGMPMVFLVRLHLATGEQEWVEAAADYFTVAEQYGRNGWTGTDTGSVAWGAAALYDLTRRRFYYDAAEAITQSLTKRLRSDGRWRSRAESDEGELIRLTAETALCLIEAVREAQ